MAKRVLENIRVLAFTAAGVGPMVCKGMAEHGATVVRVESVRRPDILRQAQPFKDGKPGLNRSGYFAMYNNDVHSMALNIAMPEARAVIERLVKWADVFVENFAPGALSRSKLGYEDVKALNPQIIMISLSQQGQTGPHRSIPGYGSQLEGVSGICHLTGFPDRAPSLVCQSYPDFVAPPFGITAIVAALDYRRRNGVGQYIDVSEYEDTLLYIQTPLVDYNVNGRIMGRAGNKSPNAAPHGAYPCKGQDQWCAIAVTTESEWAAFCKAIGSPAWTKEPKFATLSDRKRNEDDLNKLVGAWTIQRSKLEVQNTLQKVGVSAGAVQNSSEVFADPQLNHRGYIKKLDHPEIGEHEYLRSNFTLSRTPGEISKPAPLIGEHTDLVCREFLGMSEEEYDEGLVQGIYE